MPSAFTVKNDGITRKLQSVARVVSGDFGFDVSAIWDTGATCSCISRKVVSDLNLVPTGVNRILTPSGEKTVKTYLVDILLPNRVMVCDVQVSETEIGNQGLGLLIGMDIITCGDFSVSSFGGKTTFSFRVPSVSTTDYAKQICTENVIGPRHGSGKRSRK